MEWVCRERCFWRDKGWLPGETVDVSAPWKWAYSGGLWHPAGDNVVVDKSKQMTIHRCFEPLDFSVLEDPKDVLKARSGEKVEKKFAYASEVAQAEESVEEVPAPLDPEGLKPDTAPEVIPPYQGKKKISK